MGDRCVASSEFLVALGLAFVLAAGCSSQPTSQDAGFDAGRDAGLDAGPDAGTDAGPDGGFDGGPDAGVCFLLPDGENGVCLDAGDCGALPNHTPETGACSGTFECCIVTPDPANNPPIPDGWMLLPQPEVTAEMTNWAVEINDDPTDYPMFSSATKQFGSTEVMAVVQWHAPDFSNDAIHRGVTLFEAAADGG